MLFGFVTDPQTDLDTDMNNNNDTAMDIDTDTSGTSNKTNPLSSVEFDNLIF